jgi:hypothetical protein
MAVSRPNSVALRPSVFLIGMPMTPNIIHTMKHTVKASVLTISTDLGDAEHSGDLLVALAPCNTAKNLLLARRQLLDGSGRRRGGRARARGRFAVGGNQLARHLGRHHAGATHRAADGVCQGVPFHGLEQVAAGPRTKRGREVCFVFADRQHDHARRRRSLAQRGDGVDAQHARQVVVQQDDVGLQFAGAADCLAGVSRVAHHLKATGVAQQRSERAAKQGVVINDQDADGAWHGEFFLVHLGLCGGRGSHVPSGERPCSHWRA